MTDTEKKLLKDTQLEIMDEIQRVCEKYDITYYIIAGTLLGAVRHNGFIPWDLDVDIAMMREQYTRFKQVCEIELDENFKYEDYLTEKNHRIPHAMVCKKHTSVILKNDKNNPRYKNREIYVDVFPLDVVPVKIEQQERQARLLKKIRRFKSYRIPYSYSQKTHRRYLHFLVSFLLSFIPLRAINAYEEKIMKMYSEEESEYVCSMASKYSYNKQKMKKDVYGKAVPLPFENKIYYAPSKYKQYLEQLYGDYMKIPEEKERLHVLEIYEKIELSNE